MLISVLLVLLLLVVVGMAGDSGVGCGVGAGVGGVGLDDGVVGECAHVDAGFRVGVGVYVGTSPHCHRRRGCGGATASVCFVGAGLLAWARLCCLTRRVKK